LTTAAGRDHEPDVAHDGRIVFARDAGAPGLARDIFVLDSREDEARRLTHDEADDLAPAWSPDGARIAWVRAGDDSEIWVMNADGSCMQPLTQNSRADAQPAWDPRYRPGPLEC
jgi:TolB protein